MFDIVNSFLHINMHWENLKKKIFSVTNNKAQKTALTRMR